MDWLDLLAVQGTLKSLLQHHSSKASILRHSAFFTVQLSHPYMTTGKTITLTESESKVAQLCPILCTLWTGAHQAPLSMGFSRQEYCSGLPCPPPGDLPDPGIKATILMSPASSSLPLVPPRKTDKIEYIQSIPQKLLPCLKIKVL